MDWGGDVSFDYSHVLFRGKGEGGVKDGGGGLGKRRDWSGCGEESRSFCGQREIWERKQVGNQWSSFQELDGETYR